MRILLVIATLGYCYAQSPVARMDSGTTLPATCSPPLLFFKTNAVAGANVYGCTATNTWTVQTGGGITSGVTSAIGTTNQITVSSATGAVTFSIPTNPTLPGNTTGTFIGNITGNASTATAASANPANCSAGNLPRGVDASWVAEGCNPVSLTVDVSGNLPVANLNSGTSASSSTFWRGDGTWGTPAGTAAAQTHSFVCNIGNPTGTTVITTGDTGCYGDGGSFTGTINRADIIGNAASLATCSIMVDIWLASGAFPTASDKISASAPAALSSAKSSFNFARTSWSNTVPSNPVFGASVASVTGCVYAQVRVEYQ